MSGLVLIYPLKAISHFNRKLGFHSFYYFECYFVFLPCLLKDLNAWYL